MCLQLIMNRLAMMIMMLASGVAVAIGIVVMVAAPPPSATFGWFAYAPLAEATFSPGGNHIVSTGMIVGLVVLVAGLVGLAFSTGFVLGHRHRNRPN